MKNFPVFLFFLLLLACNMDSGRESSASSPQIQSDAMQEMESPRSAESALPQPLPSPSENAGQPAPEKKIIKVGNLEMEVKNLKQARLALGDLIAKHKAEIVSENESNFYTSIQNQLTVRLDPVSFEPFIKDCESLAINVQSKQITAEDVGKQFVDLEARLQTKRDVIARYREILKSAKTVTEILAVEEKLRLVVEEVESYEAQLKFLRDQVGKSTVHIKIFQTIEKPESDKRTFFEKVAKAFAGGWQVFLDILIGLVRIWPVVLILVLFIWWIIRFAKRRKNQN